MKKLILLMLVVVSALALAGCGTSDKADNSKKIVVYSSHPLEFINPLVQDFEKQTGIKVEVIAAGGGELIKRVEAESNQPLGDVVWGLTESTSVLNEKLFEEYVTANEEHFLPAYKTKDKLFTNFTLMPNVIMVNTNLVGNIDIKSYKDLLNPALKSKIAFADPSKSSSSTEHLINMLYAMGDGKPDNGWGYVEQLITILDGKLLGGSSQVYKGVADGEYAVGLTFEEAAANYLKAGAPIKLVYMAEGDVFTPNSIAIIKNAPNMENAKKFVDYMTSKDTQTFITSKLNRRSVRDDVPGPSNLEPMDKIKVISVNTEVVIANQQKWLGEFKDLFTK